MSMTPEEQNAREQIAGRRAVGNAGAGCILFFLGFLLLIVVIVLVSGCNQ